VPAEQGKIHNELPLSMRSIKHLLAQGQLKKISPDQSSYVSLKNNAPTPMKAQTIL